MPDQLRALVRLPYGNKTFLPGEKFTASPFDAKVLVMTKQAERVEDVEQVPVLLTRALEPVAEEPEKRKPGRPRKGYLRRDMKAQD